MQWPLICLILAMTIRRQYKRPNHSRFRIMPLPIPFNPDMIILDNRVCFALNWIIESRINPYH